MPQWESSIWHDNFLVQFLLILEYYNTGSASEHYVVKHAEVRTMTTWCKISYAKKVKMSYTVNNQGYVFLMGWISFSLVD